MNYKVEAVTAFLKAMEAPEDINLRTKLAVEEGDEILDAVEKLLKEIVDFDYVLTGLEMLDTDKAVGKRLMDNPRIAAAAKWSMIFKELVGPEVIKEAFLRTHISNMSKLGPDGKPIRREDGKILKSINYKPPVLTDLVMGEI